MTKFATKFKTRFKLFYKWTCGILSPYISDIYHSWCIDLINFMQHTINLLSKVCSMPWNDDELSAETNLITEQLEAINKRGVLTINSQPNVNGAPSSDIKVGWGSPNGYIYQKVSLGPYLDFYLDYCSKK